MGDRGYPPALMPVSEAEALRGIKLFRKLVPIWIGISFTDLKNDL